MELDYAALSEGEQAQIEKHSHQIESLLDTALDSYVEGDGYFVIHMNELAELIATSGGGTMNRVIGHMIRIDRKKTGEYLHRLITLLARAVQSRSADHEQYVETARWVQRVGLSSNYSFGEEADRKIYQACERLPGSMA